jgi:hypothetical protein
MQLLANPVIAAAVQKPMVVNNQYCVPYSAGRSVDDDETYVDQHIPRYDPSLVIANGQPLDIWKYTDLHEKTEFAAMTRLGMPYLPAHLKVATALERWRVEADGGDWKKYDAWWRGKIDETEHQHIQHTPPKLYIAIYPHAMRLKIERAGTRFVPVDSVPAHATAT